MKTLTIALGLFCALGITAGCADYSNVQEACHPKESIAGGNALGPVEADAVNRLNCHRRLAGIARASIRVTMQNVAHDQMDYILANPDGDRVFALNGGADYLTQVAVDNLFSGASVFERLEREGYMLIDPGGQGIKEFLLFWVGEGNPPSGAAAIDELMRDHEFREYGLQPSWVDGAYTEAEIPRQWWINADYCEFRPCTDGEPPAGLIGRAYYLLMVHSDPHLEHASRPLLYPKFQQTGVPLYSDGFDLDTVVDLGYAAPVQLGFPITIFPGVVDPTNARPGDANVYGVIVRAQISGPGGPLDTIVVLPGVPADGIRPAGNYVRQVATVFAAQPLAPSTRYTVDGEVSTVESKFPLGLEFTTAASDPGVQGAGPSVARMHTSRDYTADVVRQRTRDVPSLLGQP